jgi:hypothetical protein
MDFYVFAAEAAEVGIYMNMAAMGEIYESMRLI